MGKQPHLAAQRLACQRHGAAAAQAGAQRQIRQVPKQPSLWNIQFHQSVARADERAYAIRTHAQPARLSRQVDQLAWTRRARSQRLHRRVDILSLHGAH